MPLIKYYSFSGSNGTCYDGQRDFAFSQGSKRFYPDEYLIAHILNKYLSSQSTRIATSSKKIIVLTEKWSGNGGTRDGGKNTDSLNTQILEAIKKAKSDGEAENTLILVPFLYGYHHPGVAIDVKNNAIVYLDPFGVPASRYPEASALQRMAEAEGFDFQNVGTEQQKRGQDGTSCGPILTISMIKFIEEFLEHGRITKEGFEAPRKNLATDRLFQMYVNNKEIKEEKSTLDEIMLADERLWQSVFSEQRLKTISEKEILAIVSSQKAYIDSLKGLVIDSFNLKKIQFIRDFQSRLTELIFINPPDIQAKMETLINEGKQALAAKETDASSLTLSIAPASLLQIPNIYSVYKNLRFDAFVSTEIVQSEEKASDPVAPSTTHDRISSGLEDKMTGQGFSPQSSHLPHEVAAPILKNDAVPSAIKSEIEALRTTLGNEIKSINQSCFSFFLSYKSATKKEKYNYLTLMLEAKTLAELTERASNAKTNDRVMCSVLSSRVKTLINDIVSSPASIIFRKLT